LVNPLSQCRLGKGIALVFCVGLWLVLFPGALHAATFRTVLDRPMIEVGDAAILSLIYEGDAPAANPVIPPVPGLEIIYRSSGRQVQSINGRITTSIVASYEVVPSQPGAYTIPALSVAMGGQIYTSAPLTLTVTKSESGFLNLIPPRSEFFVGESVAFTVQLFATAGRVLQVPQIVGEGITIGTNMPHTGPVAVQTNNATWGLITWQVPITFVRSGEVELNANDCVLEVATRGWRDRFGFDMDEFIGGLNRTKRYRLSSGPVRVPVRPLPPGAPAGFNGAVGRFAIEARASTNRVTAGDPLTLTVAITGEGNLDALAFEIPDSWSNFKSYSPSTATDYSDNLGLAGTKRFELALVPDSPTVQEIPPIRFSYFDPAAAAYRTVTHPAIPLEVKPSSIGVIEPTILAHGNSSPDGEPAHRDIVHIKPRLGPLAQTQLIAPLRPHLLALQLLPVLTWTFAALWLQRRHRLASDPKLRRQREVNRRVREGLRHLTEHAQREETDAFFSTLFRLLQERIGERLDLPAAGITPDSALPQLSQSGVDEETLSDLDHLFQLCDQARFTPDHTSADMLSLIPQIENVFTRLYRLNSRA
jgi:hypothetical protein